MIKYTVRDFNRDFPNDDTCLDFLKELRWPNGIYCLTCERITKHHRIRTRMSYACDFCGHHVHPMAGTKFEKTRTPLTLWFHAVFVMASTRCGVSAKQLERELGLPYPFSAEVVPLARIYSAFPQPSFPSSAVP